MDESVSTTEEIQVNSITDESRECMTQEQLVVEVKEDRAIESMNGDVMVINNHDYKNKREEAWGETSLVENQEEKEELKIEESHETIHHHVVLSDGIIPIGEYTTNSESESDEQESPNHHIVMSKQTTSIAYQGDEVQDDGREEITVDANENIYF